MSDSPVTVTRPTEIRKLLKDAEFFFNEGKLDYAYNLSLQATQLFPQEILSWFLRAQTAPSLEEKLMCLSRLYAMDPNFPDAKDKMHAAIHSLLEREPCLAYLDESEELYRVKSGLELYLNVPKNRSTPEPYPIESANPTQPAFRWLRLAVIGLFLGGIGAVLLAPLAVYKAIEIQRKLLRREDRIRSLVVFVLSALLWTAALPLALLFILHF